MTSRRDGSEGHADLIFVRRLFIVVAVGALVAVLYLLSDLLLILFGSVLFAVILRASAAPFEQWLGIGRSPAMALAVITILLVMGAAVVWLGPEVAGQMRSVMSTLPDAASRWAGYLQLGSWTDLIKDGTATSTSEIFSLV